MKKQHMNNFKNQLLPFDILLVSQHNMQTCRRLAATFASLRLCGSHPLGFHLFWVWAPPFAGATVPGQHLSRLSTRARAASQDDHTTPNVHLGRQTSNTNSPTPIPRKRLREGKLMNMCETRKKGRNLCLHSSAPHSVWAPLVWVWGRHSSGLPPCGAPTPKKKVCVSFILS